VFEVENQHPRRFDATSLIWGPVFCVQSSHLHIHSFSNIL